MPMPMPRLSEMTPAKMPLNDLRGDNMNMEDRPKIHFLVALNKTQGLIEPVTKDKQNPHYKSGYASLAAVNETIMGPLAENGFVLLSGGVEIGGKPWLRTTLLHVDGHSMSFDYPLLVNDDNPQKLASATTYARRYSLCAFFNLSTEDDDGNAASASSVKTVTREPASFTAKKEAEKAAVTPGELEVVRFIPSKVVFCEGKGKGAGKTFSEIYDGAVKYGGNEMQGQLAQSAIDQGKVIAVCFKRVGNYLNIGSNGVKFVDPPVAREHLDDEAVPF